MFTYVCPARVARRSSSHEPASIPCEFGPTTSARVITPSIVPATGGQGGFPPPPQRNAETPPFALRCAKWMCEASVARVSTRKRRGWIGSVYAAAVSLERSR